MNSRPMDSYFAHTLLQARDWQNRQEFEEVCDWWQGKSSTRGGAGICALVGIGGAGKTAVIDQFLRSFLNVIPALDLAFVH